MGEPVVGLEVVGESDGLAVVGLGVGESEGLEVVGLGVGESDGLEVVGLGVGESEGLDVVGLGVGARVGKAGGRAAPTMHSWKSNPLHSAVPSRVSPLMVVKKV